MEEYTFQQLKDMNSSRKWSNRILLPDNDYNRKYKIYPTWNANLNGRFWQAIRSGRIITPEVKRIYNLT